MNLSTVTALSASETARTDSTSSSTNKDSNASQPNSFTALFSSHLNEEQNRTQQNTSNTASQNVQNKESQPQPVKQTTAQSTSNTTPKTENTSAKQADDNEDVDAQTAEANAGEDTSVSAESPVQSSLSALLKQSHATHGKSTAAQTASTATKTDAAAERDDAALTLGDQVATDTGISVTTADQDASSTIMAMLGAGLAPQLQKVTPQPITPQSEGVAALTVDGQNALQTLTDGQQSTSLTSMLNAVADDTTTGQDDDDALTDILGRVSGKSVSKGTAKDDDSTDLKSIVVDTTATSNKVQSADISAAVSNAFKVTQEPSSTNSNSSAATVNSALGALNSTQANTSAAATPQTAVLTSRLGSDEWQQALSQQVVMFTRNNQQNVELRLHPQELGAIQVSMKMDDNQAQIHLASAHGQVRAALEAAMPQLRTALSESGITLNQSSVGSETFAGSEWQQGQQQSAGGGSSSSQYSSSLDTHMEIVDVPVSLQRIASSSSGVDTFA